MLAQVTQRRSHQNFDAQMSLSQTGLKFLVKDELDSFENSRDHQEIWIYTQFQARPGMDLILQFKAQNSNTNDFE